MLSVKSVSTTLIAGAALLATSALSLAQDAKPNLVTVISSADIQTQGMALVLSLQSKAKGANVRILLCDKAGDLALKDSPKAEPLKGANATPAMLLKKALGIGIPAEVCALYLPNKGVKADALIKGVGVAKPPVMAGHLLADDTRLLTF
ncbi:MAG: hypothetical protein OIF54_18355 [Cohaesibacter sp.]|nr:hypothetical protein [Cohaesibacter sp.]